MDNLIRRGLTYYARFHIPRARQRDAGFAFSVPKGLKRDHTRTLETRDHAQAVERLPNALAAIRAEIDARLRAAGLRPLTSDWAASLDRRAVALREELQAANTAPYLIEHGPDGERSSWTERDDVRDRIAEEARELADATGQKVADRFYRIAAERGLTIGEARDQWLAWVEAAGRVRAGTVAGHKAALALLGEFLKARCELPSLAVAPLEAVTRRTATAFIAWRLASASPKTKRTIDPATVQRELSSLSGLWRWARRHEFIAANPWEDQSASLPKRRAASGAVDDDDDPTKRPYTAAELVALLRAGADDWSPNGGG